MAAYKNEKITLVNFVASLISNGYTDELKEFTKGIENKPSMVNDFANAFNSVVQYSDSLATGLDGNSYGGNPIELSASFSWNDPEEITTVSTAIMDSNFELEQFIEDNPHYLGAFLKFVNHHTEVTVNFGWIDSNVGKVLWDRVTMAVANPVMEYAELRFLFNSMEYVCEPKAKELSEPPLYQFHPERFKAFHECADQIGKIYRHQVDIETGFLTLELLNKIMGDVVQEVNGRILNYPRRLTLNAPSASHVIESMEILSTAYGRFVQAGRQIMDFPPALMEMLSKTDVDEIPLNAIKTPYASQYLHFGVQDNLELESGWFVDGAYVETRGQPGDIRFTITAAPLDRKESRLWFVHPEPQYTQDFVGEYREMNLAMAMSLVFKDNSTDLAERTNHVGGDITDKVANELMNADLSIPDSLNIVDVSPAMAGERIENLNRRHPVYQAALRLVINAICYVTAYPDDIEAVWPEGTPVSLSDKADKGQGKESVRAKSKLSSMGYVPVHICGKRILEQIDKSGSLFSKDQKHPTAHWRRGHWRNQAHGPSRSLRKLIWLMPVLVAVKSQDDIDEGHVYLIS